MKIQIKFRLAILALTSDHYQLNNTTIIWYAKYKIQKE